MKNLNVSKNELRIFGLIFVIFFLVYFFYNAYFSSIYLYWPIVFSIIIFFITIFLPRILIPFLKLWIFIGIIIGKIVSPLALGFVFFFVVTPTSVFRKFYKKDPLEQQIHPELKSYWKKNDSRDIDLKDQF